MSSKLPIAIALTLLVGWQLATVEPSLVSRGLLAAAAVLAVWMLARGMRRKPTPILFLGSGSLASTLIDEIESRPNPSYLVLGVVADECPEVGSVAGTRWLGTCDQLGQFVERLQPERIVLAVADRRAHLPLQSLLESRARGVVVEDGLDFYERLTGQIAIEALPPSMLIMGRGFRNHGVADVMARAVSVVGAAIGLLLTAPLLAVAAIAIKLDSPGPVLFIRDRAGRDGRPFPLVKLRTMHPSEEERSEWVLDNADRITRVGKWLRRFRIDELPQLVNVLRGDMNLIGPRPHPTSNHAVFMEHIAYYSLRSTVHPGVTGWAQVRHGYANNLAEETEKMRYDLYYIKNRTLLLDAKILFETIGCVAIGRGVTAVRRPEWRAAAATPYLTGQHTAKQHAGRP